MAFVDPQKVLAQLDITPGMEVADLGAGAGYYTTALAELVGSEGKVYSVEIQQELLTKAKTLTNTQFDNIEYLQGDIEEPKGSHLADSVADLVLLSNVLFQAEHKKAVLEESFRVLKRGGRLVVIDWTDSFGGLGPQPEYIVSEEDMVQLAKSIGFAYEKSINAGEHHWAAVLGK